MTYITYEDLEGGRGGPHPPWNLQSLILPILLETKKIVIFIFVHFHSYTSNRINPLNNNQITSIQVCVMGLLDPPWKNFLDPRLYNVKEARYITSQASEFLSISAIDPLYMTILC